MRVIFLSEKPCALTVGGAYLGLVDGFERAAELSPADALFCELSPCGFQPVRFRFDEAFLLSPPPQITLIFGEGGVTVYASGFLRPDASLSVVWQRRIGGDRFTLCIAGKVQLHLENETGFHIVDLPDPFAACELQAVADGYLLTGEGAFALLARDGAVRVLSEGRVTEAGERVKAEIPLRDCLGHSAVCEWQGGELAACSVRAAREPTDATFALALFESALVGADCTPFLHPALRGKADLLKKFLGDYRFVTLTEDPLRVGLGYLRRERVYDVRYYRVETEDGTVKNIVPL